MTLSRTAQVQLCWVSLCWVSLWWMLHFTYCYDECCYTECHYAECCILLTVMLNVVMLSVLAPYYWTEQFLQRSNFSSQFNFDTAKTIFYTKWPPTFCIQFSIFSLQQKIWIYKVGIFVKEILKEDFKHFFILVS